MKKSKLIKSTTKAKSAKPVQAKTSKPTLVTKRFVIRKSLIGQGIIFKYTNYDGKERNYDHDLVYNTHQERFDNMYSFQKHKNYTQTHDLPKFVRDADYI
tara:strand:+ start:129 stop:428 length:300 start_codon:yes stop_codon:yes gene_type:complete